MTAIDAAQVEALAVEQETRRWLERAVIGLNLCPFAKAVYVKNQVRIDTTLLVHPQVL